MPQQGNEGGIAKAVMADFQRVAQRPVFVDLQPAPAIKPFVILVTSSKRILAEMFNGTILSWNEIIV